MKLDISKMDAARRQLDVAIELYFRSFDSVAIHTLAAASRNMLADLCEHKGRRPDILLEAMLEEFIREDRRNEIRVKFREAENFFKHADRDPDRILTFSPDATEYWLLEALEAYFTLADELTPMMFAFRSWWMIHNKELAIIRDDVKSMLDQLHYSKNNRIEFLQDFMASRYAQYR